MRTLLDRIPGRVRIALIVAAAVAAIWLMFLHDDALAPAVEKSGTGIVAFEFAATPERAEEILDGWGRAGRAGAEKAIRIDYAFIVAYTVLIGLGTATMARRATGTRARLGWWLAGLMLVAGALDAMENTLLLRVIDGYHEGTIGDTATRLAAVAAGAKFTIVIAASLFIMVEAVRTWGWPARSARTLRGENGNRSDDDT